MKIFLLLFAVLLGGLALAGVQRATHYPDVPTLVGDIIISLLLLAGAWACLTRVNHLSEARRTKPQEPK
ncbi:hypothetical protein [Streptomyces echinatus]|uniref:Outer membrane murein-binding lipoprotein Lpp n=1 Tax=Streptomyces echinatus TaxID=67293 RepID=A0A7W9Q2D5_9ACTN|nr:hypothetical protein [Streptomyces echinatus]MBB5932285.1 outer membrane murein-binding lipoprotein Lpp [Streptomyces echinatus]